MELTTLIIMALATWRVTSMLVEEDGPWGVFAKLRHLAGIRYDEHSNVVGDGFLSELFSCVYCMSVWVGVLFVSLYLAAPTIAVALSAPFALSTVAIMIDRLNNG